MRLENTDLRFKNIKFVLLCTIVSQRWVLIIVMDLPKLCSLPRDARLASLIILILSIII